MIVAFVGASATAAAIVAHQGIVYARTLYTVRDKIRRRLTRRRTVSAWQEIAMTHALKDQIEESPTL